MKKMPSFYSATKLAILILISSCSSLMGEYDESLLSADAATVDTQQTLTTIAFGSCNKQDEPQPMWEVIAANQPDLWVWLGDNIYGDTTNMQVMQNMYAQQKSRSEYEDFFQSVPVIGTWDDHDYGANDAGKEFGPKEASRDLLLDFLDVPSTREIRQRQGAYDSYTFGPMGKQVKIILLDTRYFRDRLDKSSEPGKRYQQNLEGDILGKDQWDWLTEQLTKSQAQINIIASSIQVIAEDHPFEKWANFPQARERILQLVAQSEAKGIVFLSGDRHIGEMSRLNVAGIPYPVYDITSSGLTHSYEAAGAEQNRHREGKLIGQKNFGLIEISWNDPVQVTYSIQGTQNEPYQTTSVTYPQ